MFPFVYAQAQSLPRLTFVSMLAGFVAYHIAEKSIYKHTSRDNVVKKLEIQHSLTLFFYHFSIGAVFMSLIRVDLVSGFLFFLPVSLHVIINALPHSHRFQKPSVKAFFNSAPFVGSVFALVLPFPRVLTTALIGIVAGILLFIEVREVIPKKQKGSSSFFLLGVILYGILIGASWIL